MYKIDCQLTANEVESWEYYRALWEDQVNFVVTQPKSSDPPPPPTRWWIMIGPKASMFPIFIFFLVYQKVHSRSRRKERFMKNVLSCQKNRRKDLLAYVGVLSSVTATQHGNYLCIQGANLNETGWPEFMSETNFIAEQRQGRIKHNQINLNLTKTCCRTLGNLR